MVVFADVNAALGARSNKDQLPEANAETMKALTEASSYTCMPWRIFSAGSSLSTVEGMVRETLSEGRPMGETHHVALSLTGAEGNIVLPTVDEMKGLIKAFGNRCNAYVMINSNIIESAKPQVKTMQNEIT